MRATSRTKQKRTAAKEERAEVVILDGRCLSRRIEFTPRLTGHIRRRYEEAGDSPEVIARSIGVAKATIQRLVREQDWTRAAPGPRDLSRAAQLEAQARALAAETGAGEGAVPAVDIDEQIERLLRLVSAEIGVYATMRAQLRAEPEAPREALKTAHNLGSLTSTLDTLRRMRAGQMANAAHDDNDDLPADIDAFRDELARRIDAFVASRTDAGDAGDAAAGRIDEA